MNALSGLSVQAATEERALQYAAVARLVSPLLVDSHQEPCLAVEVPLPCCGRHLILARMPVSRRAKVRWSAEVLGISLAVQVRGAAACVDLPSCVQSCARC
jgi:hypothetical protein